MHNKIKEVRNSLGLSVDEFAKKCDVPASTIYAYEKNKRKVSAEYINSLLNTFDVNPIWLFTSQGDMFIDSTYKLLNYSLNATQKNTLASAIETAQAYQKIDELFYQLEEFNIFTKIQTKFRDINAEQSFWKQMISGIRLKTGAILILGKVLNSFEYTLKNNSNITEENSKELLKQIIKEYQLSLLNDKIKHFLIEREKDNLINWVQDNLSDFDCYIILKNVPEILNILRDEINIFNKKAF